MNLSLTVLGMEVQGQHAMWPASGEDNPLTSKVDSRSALTLLLYWSLVPFLRHQCRGCGSTLMISLNLNHSSRPISKFSRIESQGFHVRVVREQDSVHSNREFGEREINANISIYKTQSPEEKGTTRHVGKKGHHPSPLQEVEMRGRSTMHLVEALGTTCENTDVWARSIPTGSTKKLPDPLSGVNMLTWGLKRMWPLGAMLSMLRVRSRILRPHIDSRKLILREARLED